MRPRVTLIIQVSAGLARTPLAAINTYFDVPDSLAALCLFLTDHNEFR